MRRNKPLIFGTNGPCVGSQTWGRSVWFGEDELARVLVVEDETQVLVLAESILQEAGHETITASTVAEGQAIINSDERFDLLFTDIGLANHTEGGVTLGKLAANGRNGTPVLYTSGRPATDGMQSLFAEHSAFLPKPYTAPQLTEAVEKLLAKLADGKSTFDGERPGVPKNRDGV